MVKITEQDKKLFDWLYKVRYAKVEQIMNYLNISKDGVYQRLSKLQRNNYIDSLAIDGMTRRFYANGSLVRAQMEKRNDQKKVRVYESSLKHHLKIVDVYLKFLEFGIPEESILTSRDIYRTKKGISNKKSVVYKVPDLVIERKDGILVAIEVELSQKNNENLRQVLKNYRINKFDAVYYLCGTKAIQRRINSFAKSNGASHFIRAYDKLTDNIIFWGDD
jgi:hypothetical protein